MFRIGSAAVDLGDSDDTNGHVIYRPILRHVEENEGQKGLSQPLDTRGFRPEEPSYQGDYGRRVETHNGPSRFFLVAIAI